MPTEPHSNETVAVPNLFTGADVADIARECGRLSTGTPSAQISAWCERAASILGPHVSDRPALGELLALIFSYDATGVLKNVESHAVLARYGARDVVRKIALLLLDGRTLDSEHLKEIVNTLKETSDLRSRDLFLPIRLALTGKVGGGELDRVVLLLDDAAELPFLVPVKSAKVRISEFCAALD
ncbi:MAG TPA: hypothetical protein VIM00_04545 [Candidatus Acidoferrum sp.]|jgi:glutamyl/glutaminyl-tRNA synthetase